MKCWHVLEVSEITRRSWQTCLLLCRTQLGVTDCGVSQCRSHLWVNREGASKAEVAQIASKVSLTRHILLEWNYAHRTKAMEPPMLSCLSILCVQPCSLTCLHMVKSAVIAQAERPMQAHKLSSVALLCATVVCVRSQISPEREFAFYCTRLQ